MTSLTGNGIFSVKLAPMPASGGGRSLNLMTLVPSVGAKCSDDNIRMNVASVGMCSSGNRNGLVTSGHLWTFGS